eukprot:Sro1107_g242120.2  (183) ;mRNA; r:29716-30264
MPPGPSVGAISSFQGLVARAALEELPVIMVSPRFLANEMPYMAGSGRGWDQSVGSSQAATYGGAEPPNGPTPWVLRDFNPPVFCWIGNAVYLNSEGRRRRAIAKSGHGSTTSEYSQIVLTQTVMDGGHPWHVFAARREVDGSVATRGKETIVYDYLASTKTSSGRPTRSILQHILSEFGTAS